jgi:hypothetical protein
MTDSSRASPASRRPLAVAALSLLIAPPAQALMIDGFAAAPDAEFARLLAGTAPNDFDVFADPSALGWERETRVSAIGGIAIAGFDSNALELSLLGSTLIGSDQVQNIISLDYDGIDGAPGVQPSLDADLSDGGASDRFIVTGALEQGQSGTNPSAPASLLAAMQVYGSDGSVGAVGADLDPGPVASGDPEEPFRIEALFSDLSNLSGDPIPDLASVAGLTLRFNFSGASTGILRIDELCTGDASGCVPPPSSAVPVPAAGGLLAAAIAAALAAARRRRPV